MSSAASSSATLSSAASSSSANPALHHPTLNTTFEGVEHPLSTPDARLIQYRGIQYGAFDARFHPSRVVSKYPDHVDATDFGPVCPQARAEYATIPSGPSGEREPSDCPLAQDEFACLNLNITCPARAPGAPPLPVMVWIHGGGNHGSGSNWMFNGAALVHKSIMVHKPVVHVTFNYRLSIFGCAASPALREDNEAAGFAGVGNYGLRDQQTALAWIQQHIGGFGGDAGNLTLFGEGTGALDILCHLQSSQNAGADRRFQRAIVQSPMGSAPDDTPPPHTAGWQLSKALSATPAAYRVDEMRALPAPALVALADRYHIRNVDDGAFFPRGWKTGSAAPSGLPPQPVVIGDSSFSPLIHTDALARWSGAAMTKRVRAVAQSMGKASALLRAYDASACTPDGDLAERLLELVGDARWAWPVEDAAARLAAAGAPVHRYVWDQEAPGHQDYSAADGLATDLAYLFDNAPAAELDSPFDGEAFDDVDEADLLAEELASSTGSFRSRASSCLSLWDAPPPVSVVSYSHVRDAIQERWLAFAHADPSPWDQDKVFVFGPEGECGPRSRAVFEGRRRVRLWKDALEPLGMALVQKIGAELANGPTM